MKKTSLKAMTSVLIFAASSMGFAAVSAQAGPIFITGHDPDFHAQVEAAAVPLLQTGLSYVTGGTFDDGAATKFLWVESNLAATSGHLVGANSLTLLGLVQGINYDRVDAAGFALANLSNYTAIAIASTFGGMLTQAEIYALIARNTEIAAFVNAGGGLFASSECGIGFTSCDASNVSDNASLFGFLPGVSATAVSTSPPYSITPFGTLIGAPYALSNVNLQSPTHNSFAFVSGLTPVDLDAQGNPTTLAGDVRINNGGFTPVPEPSTLALIAMAFLSLFGFAVTRRRADA